LLIVVFRVPFSAFGFLLCAGGLSKFFTASLCHDFLPQALVSLLRGDVVDARMVVLRVVPGKGTN